jgi:homoserine acetyltransferase
MLTILICAYLASNPVVSALNHKCLQKVRTSAFTTSDDLFIVGESIFNTFGRRKMIFLVLRISTVNDFQLYFKIVNTLSYMERIFCSKFDSNFIIMYHLWAIYLYYITETQTGCTLRLDDRFVDICKKSKDRKM